MKTMKQLCQDALDCQSAINLSGVIHSFSDDIRDLRVHLTKEMGENFSTTALNQHPVCYLFAVQIGHLTRANACVDDFTAYSKAYDWCVEQTKKQE